MAGDEKDHWGDTLRDAERAREEQYFAERDRRLLEAARRAKTLEQETVPKCRKCSAALPAQPSPGLSTDECPGCRGV